MFTLSVYQLHLVLQNGGINRLLVMHVCYAGCARRFFGCGYYLRLSEIPTSFHLLDLGLNSVQLPPEVTSETPTIVLRNT